MIQVFERINRDMDSFQQYYEEFNNIEEIFRYVCNVLGRGHSFKIDGIVIMRRPLLLWCYYFRCYLEIDRNHGTNGASVVMDNMKRHFDYIVANSNPINNARIQIDVELSKALLNTNAYGMIAELFGFDRSKIPFLTDWLDEHYTLLDVEATVFRV